MNCKVCGTELKNGNLVCPNCGFDESRNYEAHPTAEPAKQSIRSVEYLHRQYIRKHPNNPPEKKQGRKKFVLAFSLGVCTAAIIVGGIFWAIGSRGNTEPSVETAAPATTEAETAAVETSAAATETAEASNARWDFDEESGVLTISGTGSMDNCYDGEEWKWSKYQYRIKEVVIEDGITNIGYEAFMKYASIISITIPDSVTSIEMYAFDGCSALTSITIPNSVTSIGNGAFWGCSSLTEITIPDTITSIGEDMFANCANLTSITLPDSITSIEDEAFIGCDALIDITIPDSVATIGDYAFQDCDTLTDIIIPDSVTSIGEDAFYSCDSLTSVTISADVTYIGDYAFHYCGQISDVYYTGSESEWDKIDIGSGNYELKAATIHYNSTQ